MLKKIAIMLLFALAFVLLPQVVMAQGADDTELANSEFLYKVNPLTITGDNLVGAMFGFHNQARFATPAGFMNRLVGTFLFPLAGIILFVMIMWGGFEMLYGANDSKSYDSAKTRITSAVIGFLLLFCAYWISQIIQTIFGVNSLG